MAAAAVAAVLLAAATTLQIFDACTPLSPCETNTTSTAQHCVAGREISALDACPCSCCRRCWLLASPQAVIDGASRQSICKRLCQCVAGAATAAAATWRPLLGC